MAFYVYQYITESGTPYYIGKGCGRRIHVEHTKTELPPLERRIIIKDGLTNEEAKQLEGKLITEYGRKLDGGILDNIKINQWACHTGWTHSEDAKRKISNGNKGKVRSEEQLKNYKGTTSKEVAAKIAKTLTGRKRPPEVIEKIRQANLGKKLSSETIAKRQAAYRITINARKVRKEQEKLNG